MAKYDYDDNDKAYDSKKYDEHQYVCDLLKSSQEADKDLRDHAREANLFVTKRDGQWEPYWWNANSKRPRYMFDMVNPVLDQVCSEIEQAAFDIKISPAGGNSTKDIATPTMESSATLSQCLMLVRSTTTLQEAWSLLAWTHGV